MAGKHLQASGATKWLPKLLQSLSFLVLMTGICALVYGIYRHLTDECYRSGARHGLVSFILACHESVVKPLVRFVSGAAFVIIGATGFLAAELANRLLLGLAAAFLLAGVLGCCSLGVYLSMQGYKSDAGMPARARTAVRRYYGDTGDAFGAEFSRDLDKYQKKHSCCGWSGRPSRNLFPRTSWHRLIIGNSTTTGAGGNPPPAVPASCCVPSITAARNFSGRDSNSSDWLADDTGLQHCVGSLDLVVARHYGIVYAADCLEQKMALDRRKLHFMLSAIAAAAVVKAICLTASVALMLEHSLPESGSQRIGGQRLP